MSCQYKKFIRSLRSGDKINLIKCNLVDTFDVITLSETWFSDNDNSDDYTLQGFQWPIRKDRAVGSIGYGGVLLWVRDRVHKANLKSTVDHQHHPEASDKAVV